MIVAVLQARMGSSRLPGKVLMPILGEPMLARQLERVGRSTRLDRLVVASSDQDADDAIDALCRRLDVVCFRGSLDDVLDRFYRAAEQHQCDTIVRLTGDCPLADPALIDDLIAFFADNDFDYASNTLSPTCPDGLDVEVFRFTCLAAAWKEARLLSEREHVTPFIYNRPERFKLGSFETEPNLSHLRWTVDEPADFELVRRIYEAIYPATPAFTMQEVLELLAVEPDLAEINTGFARNEGYEASLAKDDAQQQ